MTLTDVAGSGRVVSGHGFDVPGNAAQRVGDGVLDVRLAVELVVVAERVVHPPLGASVLNGDGVRGRVKRQLLFWKGGTDRLRTLVRRLERLSAGMGP